MRNQTRVWGSGPQRRRPRLTPRQPAPSQAQYTQRGRWEVGALIDAVIAGKDFAGQTIELSGVALNENTEGLINVGTRATFQSGDYVTFVSVWDTTDKVKKGQSYTCVVVVEESRAVKVGSTIFVQINTRAAK